MEKTKFGIPAPVLAAIVWLLGYYGGYTVALLAIGYVLLVEESEFLKRMAVKVLVFLLAFSLLNTAIDLIPSLLSLVQSLIYVFDSSAYSEAFFGSWIHRSAQFGTSILSILKMVVFLLMGMYSLFGKELKIPGLENILDKYLLKVEE